MLTSPSWPPHQLVRSQACVWKLFSMQHCLSRVLICCLKLSDACWLRSTWWCSNSAVCLQMLPTTHESFTAVVLQAAHYLVLTHISELPQDQRELDELTFHQGSLRQHGQIPDAIPVPLYM